MDKSPALSVNLSNVEDALVTELNITREEAKAFLQIVTQGSMPAKSIAKSLDCKEEEAKLLASSLVDRGMVIEIGAEKYESLHPRFAITNRYRRRCQEEGMQFKKNLKIDNIGIVLEKPYEDARTK